MSCRQHAFYLECIGIILYDTPVSSSTPMFYVKLWINHYFFIQAIIIAISQASINQFEHNSSVPFPCFNP